MKAYEKHAKFLDRMARNTARNSEQARRKANRVKRARSEQLTRRGTLSAIALLGPLTWTPDEKAVEREGKRKAAETARAKHLMLQAARIAQARKERKQRKLRI